MTSGRTEGDSWGLAHSVGATATMVAASRAVASQGPDALLDDPWADPLVRAVGLDIFVRIIDGEVNFEDDALMNRTTRIHQMTVRTRFFDDFFTGATKDGIRQAVILASGLDTRAYRLSWPAGTVVYEIDQPEVIAFKTDTLADLGAAPTAERRTIAIDLRDDWPTALREAGSTSRSRPRGVPKGCCPTCRPRLRTGCSITSPRCPRRVADWPPNTYRTPMHSAMSACSASPSGGVASVSTSTRPSCFIRASAASSLTTSAPTTGR
jgi:hypothetical protein